jgi:glutamyl-tRNA synthetase
MKISHVIRGNEYLSSTPKYNLLYQAFGWEIPQYIHLTPIMKDETRKLSKRYGDANFDDFINKGYLPQAIVNYIALIGWSPKGTQEKFTMDELIANFSISGLAKSGGIFDEKKMKWLNGEYIKELDFETFMEYAKPYFEKSDIKNKYDYQKLGKLLQTRIDIFSEIPEKVNFLAHFQKFDQNLYLNKKMKIDLDVAKKIIDASLEEFKNLDNWTEESLHDVIVRTAKKLECKSGQVYTVLRVALTGVNVTPGGSVEMADILGKEESLRRLTLSQEWLSE